MILNLVGLVIVLHQVNGQVLGIDFGTQFWKAALIAPGSGLNIVENVRSKRKTVNAFALEDGLRYFEEDALARQTRKPALSFFYLNQFLTALDAETPLEPFPGQLPTFTFANATYHFPTDNAQLALQQLIAMNLRYIGALAAKQAGSTVKDVVLTVPSFWGAKAKQALVEAARIADFSVLGFLTENSAAAIYLAVSRNDLISEYNSTTPLNLLMFNYGASNLQISAIRAYSTKDAVTNKSLQSVQVIGHVGKGGIGGLQIDNHIAKYLAKVFTEKTGIDPWLSARSRNKLLQKAKNVKQTLSASKEVQAYIEGLAEKADLQATVTRDILNAAPAFNLFSPTLDELFTQIQPFGLKKEDFQMVELIGGASRIPIVLTLLKDYFQTDADIGTHINGDESMAFGAAMRAANLSITLKIKPLHFYETSSQQTYIVMSDVNHGVVKDQLLFSEREQQDQRKSIRMDLGLSKGDLGADEIKMELFQGKTGTEAKGKKVEYNTVNLGGWREKYKINVTEAQLVLTFASSSCYFAQLKEAYVNVTVNSSKWRENVEYKEEYVLNTTEANSTNKESQTETQSQDTNQEPESAKSNDEDTANTENTDNTEGKDNTENTEAKETEPAKQTEEVKNDNANNTKSTKAKRPRRYKNVTTIKTMVEQFEIESKKWAVSFEQKLGVRQPLSEIVKLRAPLLQYEDRQDEVKEKSKLRNDFQTGLYAVKNALADKSEVLNFATEEQLSALGEVSTKEIEWLEENAWNASTHDLKKHLNTFAKVYAPIENRTTEFKNRWQTYNESFKHLGYTYDKLAELNASNSWLSTQIEAGLLAINATALTITERMNETVSQPLNAPPTIYNHQIIDMVVAHRDRYYVLKMTPKPKIRFPKAQQAQAQETTQPKDTDSTQSKDEENGQNTADKQAQGEKIKEDL